MLQCVYNEKQERTTEKGKQRLAMAQNRRIELCDAVYVVNINGYMGEVVKAEIRYAAQLGKEIIFHENVEESRDAAFNAEHFGR
ncbi:MAG: hypothetical protein PHD32_08620 [Eubacteriales bacterium]|nr:hypothetical protein [Eubacteriales bacterium]